MNNKNIPEIDYEQVLRENGIPISDEELNQQFADIVHEEGLITNTSKMSPFWRLISAIVTRPARWLIDALINITFKNMYLATASGKWLDIFSWGVNLSRKPATKASGVIRFYRAKDAGIVTVPAGTLVQTERINGTIYNLTTIETKIIDTPSMLIPVIAEQAGEAYNLAPGYFRILPVAISGIEQVQNEENWLLTPGADAESDNDLRDRCRNQYNLVGNYHTDAVYRGIISSVVGLSIDRIYFEHDAPRGAGTANVYLLLDAGVSSAPFIQRVNDYLMAKGNHGHGDDILALPLPETKHSLTVDIYLFETAHLDNEDSEKLRRDITHLIRCAFRENSDYNVQKTWPYSRFSLSRLGEEIHQSFKYVESVVFAENDILSKLNVPRLGKLEVRYGK